MQQCVKLAHQKSHSSHCFFLHILYRKDAFSTLYISCISNVTSLKHSLPKVLKLCSVPGHAHSLQQSRLGCRHTPTRFSGSNEATRTYVFALIPRLSSSQEKLLRLALSLQLNGRRQTTSRA